MRTIVTLIICIGMYGSVCARSTELGYAHIDVKKTTCRIEDSLLHSGVDTLFVYRTACDGCEGSLAYTVNDSGVMYPLSTAEPIYIFWMKNGSFYVKKIDQFFIYKTLLRPSYQCFPLFDYYFRNSDSIISGSRLGFQKMACYPKAKDTLESNYADVFFRVKNDTTRTIINLNYYFPVCNHSSKDFEKKNAEYYLNINEERIIWLRMIQSALLETEYKDLWQRE